MVFSAAILASIFRRAARIISSRLRCRAACLSSRFELHPLALASACCAHSVVMRSCNLYRVIRSGSAGFEGALAADDPEAVGGVADGGGGGGWNLAGGCKKGRVSKMTKMERSVAIKRMPVRRRGWLLRGWLLVGGACDLPSPAGLPESSQW